MTFAAESLDDCLLVERVAVSKDRQAHARTFKLVRAVQTIEHLEELVRVRHVEPDAVVSDEVDSLSPLEARGDFHAGARSGAAELEGVAKEVRQDLLQESPIPDGRW